MVNGYIGKQLRVNLTTGSCLSESIDLAAARRFLGGRGYCAKLLYDELPPGIDPLGPENKIIYGTGPLTGAPAVGADRYVIVTKSPATGLFVDTYAGGAFGPELKFAGYDFVIIEGQAPSPVFLWIHDGAAELKDASHLWGKLTWEAETELKSEVKEASAHVSLIGPAGEHLSNFAMVQTDYYHQCGRGGVGAVMGSKNLKAVVVRGKGGIQLAHPQKVLNILVKTSEDLRNTKIAVERMKYGTQLTINFTNPYGICPTHNYRSGQFDEVDKLDADAFRKRVTADVSCYGCIMGCTKMTKAGAGPYASEKVGGPEYETIALFGPNIGNDSPEAIIHINGLCDQLGLDTVSTGNTIGWAMECYEKGILTQKDLGGLDLKWGNMAAVEKLVQMIAYREGIGDLLSQGVKKAAETIGQGSGNFAMQAKGLEYPAYRPGISSPGFALAYAITDRGACHRRAWPTTSETGLEPFSIKGRAELVKRLYDMRIPWHCAITCDFPMMRLNSDMGYAADLFSAVTGWNFTAEEMQTACDRLATLLRSFNICEGMKRADDTLAFRTFEPEPNGPGTGKALTREMLDQMLDEYYHLRGWNESGIPTRDTLKKLDIQEAIDRLEAYGIVPEEGGRK